jgi:hypothetical protein
LPQQTRTTFNDAPSILSSQTYRAKFEALAVAQIPAEQPEELFDILDEDHDKPMPRCQTCAQIGLEMKYIIVYRKHMYAPDDCHSVKVVINELGSLRTAVKDQLGLITSLQFHESVKYLWPRENLRFSDFKR